MTAIPFPNINPIAFNIGGVLEVSWYSLAYIFGIIIGYYLFLFLGKKSEQQISRKMLDDMIIYIILGIVIGGRLGFVLFYGFQYYASHPLEIFKTWEGGMSFHGGMLGLIIALYLFCKNHKIDFFPVTDLLCCVVTPGIMLGRVANFINAELYGRVTSVSWGVIFPNTDFIPRHPSQLYEAAGEGIILFVVMLSLFYFTNLKTKHGALTGAFLVGYSLVRITVEHFREPDIQIGYIMEKYTLGQILSLPMLCLGLVLILKGKEKY